MQKKKNNEYEIDIESIAYGGSGVGRREDGKVVFVKYVLPGERVLVKEKKERTDYVRAVLVRVLKSSPQRTESNCLLPVGADGVGKECFAKTPGCLYQEYTYDEELRIKNTQFKAFIGDSSNILEPFPAPEILHYRNKITLHVTDDHGDISLGYNEEKGQDVIDVERCPLAKKEINETLCELRGDPGFKQTIREGMTFTLRYTENDGVQYWRNNPPSNASWLKEKTCLGNISVPIGSFFQVNPSVTDILITKVKEVIEEFNPQSVIDLYCGCGLFSIVSAKAGVEIITGLDSDENSIKAAEYNAKQYDIKDALFLTNFADKGFEELLEEHRRRTQGELSDTVLIVDPPRNGLGRRVKKCIKESRFKGIIYISCAPDTLQRDIGFLQEAGYQVSSAQMLDMFPRTSHFESLVVLK
jgi:23S rRNA (uracil1939-C5)-methyltransferase